MKGAYKKKSRRPAARSSASYAAKKRNRRRNRRIAGVVFLVCALLAATVYLVGEGGILQRVNISGLVVSGETKPAISGQGSKNQGAGESQPSVLLGEFFTDYAWDPDPSRQSNLETASKKIDGTILAPGETFSAL